MIGMTIGFLLTAFFGLASAHIPVEKGVLVLDDHNFDDAVAVRHFDFSSLTSLNTIFLSCLN